MRILNFFLILLFYITLLSTLGIEKIFGEVNFRQIYYHVYFTLIERIVWFYKKQIVKILLYSFLIPIVLTIITFYLAYFLKNKKIISENILSLFFISIIAINVSFFTNKYSVIKFFKKDKSGSDFYETNYKNPKIIQTKKKNLILIYAESLEDFFSREDVFAEDLLIDIKNINYNKVSFNNFYQRLGTSWTIAGIVSTQCGVPLNNFMYSKSNKFTEKVNQFMPNINCLGDILKKEGYKNIFMKSQDARFAGTKKFLNSHGYDEILDKGFWDKNNKIESDFDLFKYAKKKVLDLEKDEIPYNLSILSYDMHMPTENIKNESTNSKICKHLNDNIYNDNIKCFSLIITDFINFLISKNILDNATVVLVGDHLAMNMTPELNDKYLPGHSQHSRTIFNYIFSEQIYKKNRDIVFHFDFLPTILHTLNFKFSDNRYGLGASGFGNLSKTFRMHKIDDFKNNNLDILNYELDKFSSKYNSFWIDGK